MARIHLKLLDAQSPCLGCEKRRVGCHNPDVCKEWADFVAEADEEREARAKSAVELNIVDDYITDHLMERRRKAQGKVRAKIDKMHR